MDSNAIKDYFEKEHILVCLSSSPSNAKIIYTAATMAKAFNAQFTALFVHSSKFEDISDDDKKRLHYHISLAEKLGATITTIFGEDVAYQIAEFARISKVSKIVLGRSRTDSKGLIKKTSLTEKLIENAPNLDIYIIPDLQVNNDYKEKKKFFQSFILPTFADIVKTFLIIILATFVGVVFSSFNFTEANIITIYILGVLLISIFTSTVLCSVIASLLSVLVFNFFFTEPFLTLHAYDPGYLFTFAIMLIVSLITGSLANQLKTHAQQSAQSAYRTKMVFDTNQLLQKAQVEEEIIDITATQLMKLLNRNVIAYAEDNGKLKNGKLFSINYESNYDSFKEKEIVEWVFENKKRAGVGTAIYNNSSYLYHSIRLNGKVFGVIGIDVENDPLDSFENNILLSILGECALAIENIKNAKEKEEAAILAQNEKMKANLLRTISHDLRTPLTSISGNASNLIHNFKTMDTDTRNQVFKDIYEDSIWLIELVENLLSITRLEEGKMSFNISTQVVEDVLMEALQHIRHKALKHEIVLELGDELLLAKMDAKLIIQVVINLIDNAIRYTPEGSLIKVMAEEKNDYIYIHVKDNGQGIPDDIKPKVFEMFYCGNHKIADGRRSLGLGLALCKSIIEAHGGHIELNDNEPHGCMFSFNLMKGEVVLYE